MLAVGVVLVEISMVLVGTDEAVRGSADELRCDHA